MNEIRDISMTLIDEPEFVLRAEIDDLALDELANDIRDNGLYYPIIVKPRGDRFEVVDGHRRYLAHKRLVKVVIRCIVQDENSPPAEAVKLKTNLLRENNTDAEIAVWLGELATHHGYSLEDLCNATGRSESWINARVDLLRGDPEVLQSLGERKINFAQAQALNRCPDEGWRRLGLHYAEADNVPALKLKEWLVRNCPPVSPVSGPTPAELAPPPEVQAMGPGIICEFCGGWKDPHNMVQVWLHRWEWDMVKQILNRTREAAAGVEP